MYAIVSLAGKQTILELGAYVDTDLVNAEVGSLLDLNEVLCFHDGKVLQIGKPLLDKYNIQARVVEHAKSKKIRVVHFKRRQNHLKWQGSRAQYTKLQIMSIKGPGVNEVFVEPKDVKSKTEAAKSEKAESAKPRVSGEASPKKTTKASKDVADKTVKKTVSSKPKKTTKKDKTDS
ncbi:MAG: 50S ribosomal protein L21 [Pseudomonadota bacterium]|nr:50S ribosomal protein L21 [Pseudomonadota bacterium]